VTDAIACARQIAKRVLDDQYDPLLACRDLVDIREQLLSTVSAEVMDVFVAVESGVQDLPIGPGRAHWAEASLRVKDKQAANYREQVRNRIEGALRAFLKATGNGSPS
jgi:hypothetical protein